MRYRKSFQLPLNADPELIFQQEHYWSYAVFVGGLLHDIGKMVTSTVITLKDGTQWNPHQQNLLMSHNASTYYIEFCKHPYKYHTQIANSFFHLLPPKGRGWLAEMPDIFTEVCAWLYGDYYEYGTIGKIIRFADSASVANNLKLGGERHRLSNAPEVPLIEKMMTALRDLIATNVIKINGRQGSSGWTDKNYTYLVCGTVADKVRAYLANLGTSIPSDNTRLFDTWQEHGYSLSNPEDGSIWNIVIDNKLKLTALKFESNRLYHPSHLPSDFEGSITVTSRPIENEKSKSEAKENQPPVQANTNQESEANTQHSASEPKPEPTSSASPADELVGSGSMPYDDPFADSPIISQSIQSDNETELSNQSVEADTSHSDTQYCDRIPSEGVPEAAPQELEQIPNIERKLPQTYQFESQLPGVFKLSDPKIAQYFLMWMREGLRNRVIQVNNSKALVHIVKEGALIVSPLAFKKFIWEHKLNEEGDNINKQMARIQEKLRSDMERKKKHLRTKAGTNIHVYQITGERKTIKIKCWLLPIDELFKDTIPPSINDAFENISGFEN